MSAESAYSTGVTPGETGFFIGNSRVEQLVAYRAHNSVVVGSSPTPARPTGSQSEGSDIVAKSGAGRKPDLSKRKLEEICGELHTTSKDSPNHFCSIYEP